MTLKHPKAPGARSADLAVAPHFNLETRTIPRHSLPDEEMSPDPLASFIGTEKGRRMQRLLENAELSGVAARGRLEVGEPAEVIPIVATAGDYDLIVMGTYPQSGLARFLKNGVVAEVVRFAPCPVLTVHHPEREFVMAADAVSGARPGARRESIENYVKRLEALEKIADSFPGVEKSYAIQAGREVRIMVEPKNVDDSRAATLAADVARRVERELQYPGMIKVVVIRETRAMEYAK